jgi:antirestriction protein ArdC
VVKYGTIEIDREETTNDEDTTRRRGYLRAYRVFNANQVEGLPETYYSRPDPAEDLGTEPDAELEAYFGRLGAQIETSAEPRAYYHPGRDVIHMPPIASFLEAQGYYKTLGHECVHHAASVIMPRGLGCAQPRSL